MQDIINIKNISFRRNCHLMVFFFILVTFIIFNLIIMIVSLCKVFFFFFLQIIVFLIRYLEAFFLNYFYVQIEFLKSHFLSVIGSKVLYFVYLYGICPSYLTLLLTLIVFQLILFGFLEITLYHVQITIFILQYLYLFFTVISQ